MKPTQARSKHTSRGHTCRVCGNVVKAGQWFVERQMPHNPITDRWFTMHVRCLKNLVADVPEDEDRAQQQAEKSKAQFEALRSKGFETLRDEILTTN